MNVARAKDLVLVSSVAVLLFATVMIGAFVFGGIIGFGLRGMVEICSR